MGSIAALTFVLCTMGSEAAAQEGGTVALMRNDLGLRVAVNTEVKKEDAPDFNGRTYHFVIDTGATQSIVSAELRRDLGLETFNGPDVYKTGTAAPWPETEPIVLRMIGREDFIRGALVDQGLKLGSGIDGLIGLDILWRYYSVYDIKVFRSGERRGGSQMPPVPYGSVTLHDEAPDYLSDQNWIFVPMEPRPSRPGTADLYFVEADFKRAYGRRALIPCFIDTGSPYTIINTEAYKALQPSDQMGDAAEQDENNEESPAQIVALIDEQPGHILIEKPKAGGKVWPDQHVYVRDLPVFDLTQPSCLFGLDLLAQQDFALDFKHKRLLISRRALVEDDSESGGRSNDAGGSP